MEEAQALSRKGHLLPPPELLLRLNKTELGISIAGLSCELLFCDINYLNLNYASSELEPGVALAGACIIIDG